MLGAIAEDTIFDVVGKQEKSELVEGGSQSRNLSKNVYTVPFILDHFLDAAYLPRDSG